MRAATGFGGVQGIALAVAGLLAAGGLCGCVVAGVSSGGGWFIWPGGVGFLVMILIVFLLLRRRR